jgi:hypothetical protein
MVARSEAGEKGGRCDRVRAPMIPRGQRRNSV